MCPSQAEAESQTRGHTTKCGLVETTLSLLFLPFIFSMTKPDQSWGCWTMQEATYNILAMYRP